jgi:protein-tyrosine phosphatase
VNLRVNADPRSFGARTCHLPAPGRIDRYDTGAREVRRWLNDVLAAVASEDVRWPVFVHCVSGKDRTGVVVASLLTVLGVPRHVVVDEYLWSDGDVRRDWIEGALGAIGEPTRYFRRVDLAAVRRSLLGTA